jgi:hypothetical protein
VTWQGNRQRYFKTWRSTKLEEGPMLIEGSSPWLRLCRPDSVAKMFSVKTGCFMQKLHQKWKMLIFKINNFKITGLYATTVNKQWANFKMSHKSLFGRNHTKPTNTLIRIIKSSLKADGTLSNHFTSKRLIACTFHVKKCRRFLNALHGIRAIDY